MMIGMWRIVASHLKVDHDSLGIYKGRLEMNPPFSESLGRKHFPVTNAASQWMIESNYRMSVPMGMEELCD